MNADIVQMLQHSRKIMEERSWTSFSRAGIAVRDNKDPKQIHYIPSNAELRILRNYQVQQVNIDDKKNDIFAGLWPKGFKELSVNAIAHTSSGNSQAVAQEMLVQGSVTIVHREIAQIMGKADKPFMLPIISVGHKEDLGDKMLATVKNEFWSKQEPAAILVADVGLFVWGGNITETMQRCECLENWFEIKLKTRN